MSALNMIVRGQHAYLLTDRAVYDPAGIVRGIGIKVARVEEVSLAVAGVGHLSIERLAAAMDHACPNSRRPEDWVARLPAVAMALREGNRTLNPAGEASLDNEVTLAAIYYSREERCARGRCITSGDPSMPAYTPVGLTCIAIPALHDPAKGPDVRSPAFDVRHDGVALLEAQRRQPWEDGMINIGGGVDLTTVGPEGLTVETLHTWPDEVGRRISLCHAPLP